MLDTGYWIELNSQNTPSHQGLIQYLESSIQYLSRKKPHRNAAFVKNLSIL